MSSSVETFLIQDDRLMVSDKVRYAVLKGAANNTIVQYDAISGLGTLGPAVDTDRLTPLTWNIQIPSQETVIDRLVMVNYKGSFLFNKALLAGAANDWVWNAAGQLRGVAPGVDDCSSADSINVFPVSQCMSTIQATINNTTVAMNVQDVLNPLLRLHDSRALNEYMGLCPYLVDRMGIYNAPQNGSTAFQAPGVSVLDESFIPRSSFPVEIVGANTVAANANADVVVYFDVWEPLLVSPFVWARPECAGAGIYGIQNMSIVANFSNNLSRFVRSLSASAAGVKTSSTTVKGIRITSAKLTLTYLTPQPSSVNVPRNIVPYYEVPRYYLTTGQEVAPSAKTNQYYAPATLSGIRSQNLQLNQIPDKLIIFFEPTEIARTAGFNYSSDTSVPDFYAVINNLTLNFNNQSGLLSTWTQKDLYHAARDAGSKQSWLEFTGQMEVPAIGQDGFSGVRKANYTAVTAGPINVPTTGSIVVLQFGKDIELPDYYAPGSIGNFNLQMNANISHYQPTYVSYRMVCITVNSGVFVNEKGTSNQYTSLLRKEDVLNASSSSPMGHHEFNRMVGGGFLDRLKSIGSSVWTVAKPLLKILSPHLQQKMAQSSNPNIQSASKLLGAVSPHLLGEGMGRGVGAGEDRLSRHARGSGYAY